MAKISINMKAGSVLHDENTIIGIDLGTTNSLVAYIINDIAVTIKSETDQSALVPSILSFDGKHIYVGEEAKLRLVTHPTETVYSVKRLMGKNLHDVKDLQSFFSFNLKLDDPDALVRIKIKDQYYTPIELSAEILRQLKRMAENHLKKNVTQAVITVPAYFNDAQRQATRDAGRLAGLDVLRIINEPTAASMAYGLGLKAGVDEKIAVFDLGGGTFDISILHIQDGVFEVLSTHGDTFLGGDDFDRAIMEHWIDRYNLDKTSLLADKGL
jgi:molecular chaperone HscA